MQLRRKNARAFDEIGGEVVQTTAFVYRLSKVKKYIGCYCRLITGNSEDEKRELFIQKNNNYLKLPIPQMGTVP